MPSPVGSPAGKGERAGLGVPPSEPTHESGSRHQFLLGIEERPEQGTLRRLRTREGTWLRSFSGSKPSGGTSGGGSWKIQLFHRSRADAREVTQRLHALGLTDAFAGSACVMQSKRRGETTEFKSLNTTGVHLGTTLRKAVRSRQDHAFDVI